jgi:hypothetical protein
MPAQHLRAVRDATNRLEARRRAVTVAEQVWRETIREAIASGIPVASIAAAAKITKARVYQIRDNRR